MKTLIYQYWDGKLLPGHHAVMKIMGEYAERIGSEYLFEDNPKWVTNLGNYSPHYGAFKPVIDSKFDEYDYIMVADVDLFPVDGLTESVFDVFALTGAHVGLCEETHQPEIRYKQIDVAGISGRNEELWSKMVKEVYGTDLPRDKENRLRVFNSGMVVWSREGREVAKKNFPRFSKYITECRAHGLPTFYQGDQNYLLAVLDKTKLNWEIMDSSWNSFMHYLGRGNNRPVNDMRTEDTKFVHIQLSAADHYDEETLYKIVNGPVEEWYGKLPKI